MSTRSAVLVLVLVAGASVAAQSPRFGVGRPPTPEEIRGLGSAIAPDGTGLPKGSGTVAAGRTLFAAQCRESLQKILWQKPTVSGLPRFDVNLGNGSGIP